MVVVMNAFLTVAFFLVCVLATAREGRAFDNAGLWARIVSNASKPVDGHFIVEMEEVSGTQEESERIKTTIEYWIRGGDSRFDVKDSIGRDFDSQIVLKGAGEIVLNNHDTRDSNVVVMQSSTGSQIGNAERDNWIRFQALLGRYPFCSLALYQESYDEFRRLPDMGDIDIANGEDLVRFTFDHGVVLAFKFDASTLNPGLVEVTNELGEIKARLTTKWRTLAATGNQYAHSGEFEEFNKDGEVDVRATWRHILAEEFKVEEDPFTWAALSPSIGKKLILTNAANEESDGGYWDGTRFAETPLKIAASSTTRDIVRLISILGLALGCVFLVFKVVNSTRRLSNEGS